MWIVCLRRKDCTWLSDWGTLSQFGWFIIWYLDLPSESRANSFKKNLESRNQMLIVIFHLKTKKWNKESTLLITRLKNQTKRQGGVTSFQSSSITGKPVILCSTRASSAVGKNTTHIVLEKLWCTLWKNLEI